MSESTRYRCLTSGQAINIGGQYVHTYYGAIIPRFQKGIAGQSFLFDSVHVYDGKGRKGSGPFFHASSYALPPEHYVLTSDNVLRPFSGCFPKNLSEAKITNATTIPVTFSVFCGSRVYHCWITNKYNWQYHKPVPASCWVYDYFDGRVVDGTLFYSYTVEQWTCREKFTFPLSFEDVFQKLLTNHDRVQYQEYKDRAQKEQYALYVTPRSEASIYDPPAYFDYYHNERDTFLMWKVGHSLGDNTLLPNYYKSGFSSAFVNAIEDIPSSSLNGTEAILDLFDLLNVVKNPLKALKSLRKLPKASDIWLKYRYVFSTTKMDVEDTVALYSRIQSLKDSDLSIKARGVYRHDDNSTFRCTLTYNPPSDFIEKLESIPGYLGEPSLADIWDIIPWSFMIDWFSHVSDFLDYCDKYYKSSEMQYDVTDVWYSVETSTNGQKVYFRIPGDPSRSMIGLPYLSIRHASSRTVAMRATDVLAIFGRR